MSNPIKTTTLLFFALCIMLSTGCDKDPEIPTFAQTCCTETMTQATIGDFSIYLPNVFSPNGDGVNDKYIIYGFATGTAEMSISIRDEDGTTIFSNTNVQLNNPAQSWDGKVNGEWKDGAYTYLVSNIVIDNVLQTGLSYEGIVYTRTGNPIACIDNHLDCYFGTQFDGDEYSAFLPSGERCE